MVTTQFCKSTSLLYYNGLTTWNDYSSQSRDHSSSIDAHAHIHTVALLGFWQVYNIISIFFHFPTDPAVHIYHDSTHELQPIKELETEVSYWILSKHTHILLSARWLHMNILYIPCAVRLNVHLQLDILLHDIGRHPLSLLLKEKDQV